MDRSGDFAWTAGPSEIACAGTNPWLESELRARPTLTAWIERVDLMTTGPDAASG